jgi:hypothetical protein
MATHGPTWAQVSLWVHLLDDELIGYVEVDGSITLKFIDHTESMNLKFIGFT